MNLFFSIVAEKVSLGIINRLVERYKPAQCYIVHALTDDYKNIKGNVCEQYNHGKVINADYSGYIFENECPPLDEKLLKSMAEHEPIIIKMIERLASHQRIDYESRVRQYHRHLRYWDYMLDAAKIEVSVFLMPPHEVYDYICYCLCKKKGITTAFSYYGPLREYRYFAKDITVPCPEVLTHYKRLEKKYRNTSIEEIELASDFQKAFELYSDRNRDRTPPAMKKYMEKHSLTFLQRGEIFVNKMKIFIQKLVCYPQKLLKKGPHHIFIILKYYSTRFHVIIKEKYEKNKSCKAYDSLTAPADYLKPYIYFPLQHQPECTTSPLGGFFVHQLLIAQMLSFHLPKNVFLYIKEHPMQRSSSRNIQFYKDLSALDNVTLIPHYTDTYQLIDNCLAIASSTGTPGFEGMFMGKPFLMFGSHINMYAPGTFNIRNNEDCKNALKYILKHGAKHTLKDMKLYLKALSEVEARCCHSADISLHLSFTENIENFEKGLARVIDAQIAKPNASIF